MDRASSLVRAGLLAAAGLVIAGSVSAGTITPSPYTVFTTLDNSKDHLLTQASPNYTAPLSTNAAFIGDVHSLIGYVTGAGGTADLLHVEGPTDTKYGGDVPFAPYAMVGSNTNSEAASVVYKFVVEPGKTTGAGGLVHMQVYFRGQPSSPSQGGTSYLGISETFLPHMSNLAEIDNAVDFRDKTMTDVFTDTPAGYDSYVNNDVTLPIPQGVSEFYVTFADEFGNGRLAVGNLTVNANIVAVPEPAALGLIAIAGLALRRSRR